jgi:hypothetical protein
MKLICSRTISLLDVQSLAPREAKEALFRDENGFVLYLSDGAQPPALEERLISLDAREALLWLNERPTDWGSFWR